MAYPKVVYYVVNASIVEADPIWNQLEQGLQVLGAGISKIELLDLGILK